MSSNHQSDDGADWLSALALRLERGVRLLVRKTRRFPFGHPLGQQGVELALAVGERVQLLPVAAVIRGKFRADGGQLRFQLAYIRLQCLHTARQAPALAFAVLVGVTRCGGG